MAKVVVTQAHDWRKIAELAGGNPRLIMFDPGPSELEVPDVTQGALDTAFATYTGDQANIDAATAAAITVASRNRAAAAPDPVGEGGMQVRAMIQLLNKRDNFNTNRIIELQNRVQAMLDSTGAVGNMRTAGLAVSISATNTRPRSDAIQDYKDDINAGGADS